MQLERSGWWPMGPREAYYDEVAAATPVFGSPAETILMAGSHEWHWHPCML